MLAPKDFAGGHYTYTPQHGIQALGRVYCTWAYEQTVDTQGIDASAAVV